MKSLIALALVLSYSTFSYAQEEFVEEFQADAIKASRPTEWRCEAMGRIPGGPGGGSYQTVWGRGATMQIAASNALSTCQRQMQQCTLGACTKY